MRTYRVSGLDVASDTELPGACPLTEADREADVVIRRTTVPTDLPEASARGPTWALQGQQCLLLVPDIARFLISAGREIAFETCPDADERDAIVFLLGSAFGILLHQRGQMVLHASAVAVRGRAVLFCGPSGAGKSTLAAALSARGLPFVNDDVCSVDMDAQGCPVVSPDGRMLKLWADALSGLALTERKGEPVRRQLEKFYATPPSEAVSSPLPVGAIYVLREERGPHKAGIERPNVVDVALMLKRNAYRPALLATMGLGRAYFASSTKVQNHAGVFHLTRPLEFSRMPHVVSWLEAHWRELGL